ncbi:MAG TPA: protein kinase [Propionibacteriaceae bacterium]|nr:protein kinase [Propionibacteriaceae bacterium]
MDSIGRYRLVRRLGAGSFATVWLGHDDDLDVPVAVKVLADNWAGNNDVRNRFLAEARIMRRIHDRRLVQVYDIGTLDDGRPYFVMDYIDGGSMNDLRRQGIQPVRALRLCAEACRALDVLHAHDIIHRDVTPGNLLLSRSAGGGGQVLIADLGVAKSMLDAVGATMTAGTPSYMAPEQAMGVTPLDRRVDIYSLAAVTYAMLTGHPPFLVRSIADILARDPSQPPEPIAERLGAPSTLDGVMISGLAADRNRRPPTALLLAEGLETIAGQMEASDAASQLANGRVSPQPPRAEPAGASETTLSELPPATAADPSLVPPPSAEMSGFEPSSPYPAPVGPPAFQTSLQPTARSYSSSGDPYATGQLTSPPPEALTRSRPVSYYILLGVSALALFAISMFLTILVLR